MWLISLAVSWDLSIYKLSTDIYIYMYVYVYMYIYITVHLDKLECREKVNFFL